MQEQLLEALLNLTATETGQASQWQLFFGRFHPLILHLPIGLLFAVILLDVRSYLKKSEFDGRIRLILLLATTASQLLAFTAGTLLALEGGYSQEALAAHAFWALLSSLLLLMTLGIYCAIWKRPQSQKFAIYRLLLFITALSFGATGHYGANMTHGSNFLTEHGPEWLQNDEIEIDQSNYYLSTIQPILTKKCSQCHGPERNKGDLRLDSPAFVKASFDKLITPGKPEQSPLYDSLVTIDKDLLMPPPGKGECSSYEIAQIRHWILEGAQFLPEPKATPQSTIEKTPVTKEALEEQFIFSQEEIETRDLYSGLVHPILMNYCSDCHGPIHQKEDLRVDSIDNIINSGMFKEGDIHNSLFYTVMTTDDEDEIMPPDGNPQLKPTELEIIRWWQLQKQVPRTGDLKVSELPENIRKDLSTLNWPALNQAAEIDKEKSWIRILDRYKNHENPKARINIIGYDNNLQATLPENARKAARKVAFLAHFPNKITALVLRKTDINNVGTIQLARMTALEKLDISNTHITGKSLIELTPLKKLKNLNLRGLEIEISDLVALTKLPKLESLTLSKELETLSIEIEKTLPGITIIFL